MAYPYQPPPSVHEFVWTFARFLSKFGYEVEVSIRRYGGGEIIECQTVTMQAYQKDKDD